MENFENKFLKDKYWDRKEIDPESGEATKPFLEAVEKSAEQERRAGEKVSHRPEDQIPLYLERIEKVAERKGELFKEKAIYPKYIIKPENISGDYIKNILLGNFAEQRGYGRDDLKNEEVREQALAQFKQETGQDFAAYTVPEEERERVVTMVVKDQTARLDAWFDYLSSSEARHAPPAFRYWAFAEMLKLGDYDAARKKFNKRAATTAASFPELDQQALALVFDAVRRKRTGEPQSLRAEDESRQAEFDKLLQSENFGDLYAFALDHVNSLRLPTERLAIAEGEWKEFSKGTPAEEMTKQLQGFNTKWCIAGEGFAEDYLSRSDVWIYFSQDADGENSIPRACIVDSGEQGITEVRGIISNEEAKQHLDSYITPVVDEKLKEMPGGEKWQGTMKHMKQLAQIYLKNLRQEPLNKEDLVFLYEIDRPIQQSGYQEDPRIDEIRASRDKKEDMLIVFECAKEQIARTPEEINENTKAYIGKWNPKIYQTIKQFPNIKHLYESFPEKKIFMYNLETDPEINSPEKAEEAIKAKNIYLTNWGKDILYKTEFSHEGKTYELARFTVEQLGFSEGATTAEIIGTENDLDKDGNPSPFTDGAMTKLGLEFCPAEVGPHLRLKYPGKEWFLIAMKQIIGRDGDPGVFRLDGDGSRLELGGSNAGPGDRWFSGNEFIFLSRK